MTLCGFMFDQSEVEELDVLGEMAELLSTLRTQGRLLVLSVLLRSLRSFHSSAPFITPAKNSVTKYVRFIEVKKLLFLTKSSTLIFFSEPAVETPVLVLDVNTSTVEDTTTPVTFNPLRLQLFVSSQLIYFIKTGLTKQTNGLEYFRMVL